MFFFFRDSFKLLTLFVSIGEFALIFIFILRMLSDNPIKTIEAEAFRLDPYIDLMYM